MLLLSETTDSFQWHICPFPNNYEPNPHIFKRREWSLFQGRPYLHQNMVFTKMSTEHTSSNVTAMYTSQMGVTQ